MREYSPVSTPFQERQVMLIRTGTDATLPRGSGDDRPHEVKRTVLRAKTAPEKRRRFAARSPGARRPPGSSSRREHGLASARGRYAHPQPRTMLPSRRSGGTGRRAGLKIRFPSGSVGSIPTFGIAWSTGTGGSPMHEEAALGARGRRRGQHAAAVRAVRGDTTSPVLKTGRGRPCQAVCAVCAAGRSAPRPSSTPTLPRRRPTRCVPWTPPATAAPSRPRSRAEHGDAAPRRRAPAVRTDVSRAGGSRPRRCRPRTSESGACRSSASRPTARGPAGR